MFKIWLFFGCAARKFKKFAKFCVKFKEKLWENLKWREILSLRNFVSAAHKVVAIHTPKGYGICHFKKTPFKFTHFLKISNATAFKTMDLRYASQCFARTPRGFYKNRSQWRIPLNFNPKFQPKTLNLKRISYKIKTKPPNFKQIPNKFPPKPPNFRLNLA